MILSLFVIAIVLHLLNLEFLSTLFLLIFFLSLYIFRNEKIELCKDCTIVSPVSGEVHAIDFNEKYKIIYINTSLFDNSILIAPQSGNLKLTYLKRGINLPLNEKLSKKLNEKLIFEQKNIKVELLSSTATNELALSKINENLDIAQKIGIFTQGEVILFIDKNVDISLQIGQKIKVGTKIV